MSVNVVILANKWWEAITLASVFQHSKRIKQDYSASPNAIEILTHCGSRDASIAARLTCRVNQVVVEVWCIEDLIPPGENSSSSLMKKRVLQPFMARKQFDDALIIAFGTAASPKNDCAGNVIVGSSVFVLDAHEGEESPEYVKFSSGTGTIVNSAACEMLDGRIFDQGFREAKTRFLTPSNNPSPAPDILADSRFVSVGVVNVSNNQDYKHFDAAALRRFDTVKQGHETHSVETTHGLIRLCVEKPFLYISGIANQVGRFNEEVQPNKYAQNFAASHNAAVCAAWMLLDISVHPSGGRSII